MTITAKFPGKCAGCGQAIEAGSKIEWSKGNPARHVACAGSSASTAAPATRPAGNGSSRRAGGARRGMGSGHGRTHSMPGFSSYCTDNASCRCYDCAS